MSANSENAAAVSLIGRRLGGHRVVAQLGQGGMGQVFLARHEALGHQRVIKLIRDDYQREKSASDRFRREAKVLAMLSHPGIVSVIDFGHLDNGWPWLCMEYIDGPDLERLIEDEGPMSPPDVIETLFRVATALLHAHAQGIIHRDLKPANILLQLSDPGLAKIIDFGLVKLVSDELLTQLTADRELVGSPMYMAPEQIEAVRDLTSAVDVYALACTAFSMLTGEPVFGGSTVLEVITRHLQEPPPALLERAAQPVPPRLNAVVDACLAKDPSARPSMSDVVAILEELRRQYPYTPRPPMSLSETMAVSPPLGDGDPEAATELPGPARVTSSAAPAETGGEVVDDEDEAPTVIPGVGELAEDVHGSFAAGGETAAHPGVDSGPRVEVAQSATVAEPVIDDGRLFFGDPNETAIRELVEPLRNQALSVVGEIAECVDCELASRGASLREAIDAVGMDLALAAGDAEREDELRIHSLRLSSQLRDIQLAMLERVRQARSVAPSSTAHLYSELDELMVRLHEAVGR